MPETWQRSVHPDSFLSVLFYCYGGFFKNTFHCLIVEQASLTCDQVSIPLTAVGSHFP